MEDAVRAKQAAEEHMRNKDFATARNIMSKVRNLFPDLEGMAQMLAVCNVHCAAETRVHGETDWYGILQVGNEADDVVIRKQYHSLELLLHPDKNKFGGAEDAFKLIAEAHRMLLDKDKRALYDAKIRRTAQLAFWTMCPFCAIRYQYVLAVMNKKVRCQSCNYSFIAYELTWGSSGHPQPGTAPVPSPCAPMYTEFAAEFRKKNVKKEDKVEIDLGENVSRKRGGRSPLRSKGNKKQTQDGGDFATRITSKKLEEESPNNPRDMNDIKVQSDACKQESGLHADGDSVSSVPDAPKLHPSTRPESIEVTTAIGLDTKEPPRSTARNTGGSKGEEAADVMVADWDSVEWDSMDWDNMDDKFQGDTNEAPTGTPSTNVSDKKESGDCIKEPNLSSSGANESGKNAENDELAPEHLSSDAYEVPASEFCDVDTKEPPTLALSINPSDTEENDVCINKTNLSSADANEYGKKAQSVVCLDVPATEFHNFEERKSAEKFKQGQIWAVYSDIDGLPHYYALVKEVKGDSFEVRYFDVYCYNEENRQWFENLPVGCGTFRLNTKESAEFYSTNFFSHLVNAEQLTTGEDQRIVINPHIGEIWALLKDWNPRWSLSDLKNCGYDLVKIIASDSTGFKVSVLTKVDGYKFVFKDNMGSNMNVPVAEIVRFSHQIPFFRVDEHEFGKQGGYMELDPAALPSACYNSTF